MLTGIAQLCLTRRQLPARYGSDVIDTFALALGHGLLAVALLRLVMRDALDTDPLLEALRKEAEDKRKAAGASARNAARPKQGADETPDA